MKTIMVYTPKGGASKSTLVREPAVCFSQRGERVAIKDLDPQLTTTTWYQRREADMPAVVPASASNKAIAANADYLFVDTLPGVGAANILGDQKRNLVLVPVRPSPDDLGSALSIVELLGKRNWVFVLTQTPPRARLNGEAARLLAAQGRLAPVNIGFRVDYPSAAISGEAACEYGSTKAAKEINELADCVKKYLVKK